MDKLKKLFNELQVDSKSVVLSQEQLNDKLLKKLKNSKYEKDKEFVNRFNLLEDKKTDFNNNKNDICSVPIKAEYVKVMILIALLYLVFMHPLIFSTLMLVICVF